MRLATNPTRNRLRRALVVLACCWQAAAGVAAVPRLGLQTWTCRQMSFDQMVDFAAEHGLERIQLYRSHVDPTAPPEVNDAKLRTLRARGLKPYAMYAALGRDEAEDLAYFRLARRFGMEFLVVEPRDQSKWPGLLRLAREHGIRLAVHNHGLDTTYGNPETVRTLLAQFGEELGVCLDVGWVTAAGFNATEVFRSYGSRVLDLHFKDKRAVEREGKTVFEDTFPGEGQVDFAGLFKAIRETRWAGTMAIETDGEGFAQDPRELVQRAKAFFQARLTGAGMSLGFDYTAPAGRLPDQLPEGIPEEVAPQLLADLAALGKELERLRRSGDPQVVADLADVEIYYKQVLWALRYEAELRPTDVVGLQEALSEGLRRASALQAGARPWTLGTGRILRGHRSPIDGSAQLYGLVVPGDLDRSRSARLDVVLHGSIQPTGAAMLRFARWFQRVTTAWPDPDRACLELYPLGRVTNGYRWAGEVDVFEAIEAVRREYSIDPERIVLRGFSMGASGTWHIGLKHPDRFAALGPYTGYVDTRFFSAGPAPNLIRVGHLPPVQERVLPSIDAVSYAANAGLVPVVAAIGGADIGWRNHEFMADAFAREGLQLVNLVSRGTGHVVVPVTQRAQLDLLGRYVRDGIDRNPRRVRFVTHTLRYNRCHWVELLGLARQDTRAEIVAEMGADGTIRVSRLDNITRFAITLPAEAHARASVRVLDQDAGSVPEGARLEFRLTTGGWIADSNPWDRQDASLRKRPRLQGPIDDAFTAPFLCVRGTGAPWNPAAAAWADAELQRFAYEWSRYFVGDLPVKDDTEVTAEDRRSRNLVLFGDPGSNQLLAEILPYLPLEWTRQNLRLGGEDYPARDHVPVLVYPSPLDRAGDRYVVINSGHTFGESALSSVSYLQFPQLGDWAVMCIGGEGLRARPVRADHFGEDWSI